jgi:glycosyltransferase involved in cell wall biosynthesis
MNEKKNTKIANKSSEKDFEEKIFEHTKIKTDPLFALKFIYDLRPDLQKTYPEVEFGDYSKLIEWAVKIPINKIGNQSEQELIESHKEWYKNAIEKLAQDKDSIISLVKKQEKNTHEILDNPLLQDPLSALLFVYNTRPDLQEVFPRVKSGNYFDLINWAAHVKIDNAGSELEQQIIEKTRHWCLNEIESRAEQENLENIKQKLETQTKTLENLENDPIGSLLLIYFTRQDLINEFPEVSNADYVNLLNWAVNTDLNKIGNEHDTLIITKYRKIYQEELGKLTTEKAQLTKLTAEKQQQKNLYEKTLLEKTELENNLKIAHEVVQQKEQERQVLTNELSNIKGSISWSIIQRIGGWLTKNFPSGSKRGNLLQLVLQFTRHCRARGFISASKMAGSFLKKSKLQSLDVNVQPKSQFVSWKELQNFDNTQIQTMKANINSFKFKPKISIIMPVYNIDEKWLRLAIDSVAKQIYENWELCITDDASSKPHIKKILSEYAKKDPRIKTKFLEKNQNIAGASNEALSLVTGEYVGLLDHDDEIYPDALYEVARVINNNENLEIIYSDENHISLKGERIDPFFKPDYSPDLLTTCHYMVHFMVYKTSLLGELGGFRRGFDGSQDYDLVLRAVEKTNQIHHIPKLLYGWRNIVTSTASGIEAKPYAQVAAKKALEEALKRRKIDGTPEYIPDLGYFKINYNLARKPLVSIIITSRDRPDLLSRLLHSIEEKTTYDNYEIMVVDHLSEKKETLDFLKSLKHKVIRYEKEFNISNLFNFAEKHANGEYLLTMNDDMEVISENWIESMLGPCQKEEVAIVGAQLIYPHASAQEGLVKEETIQHAGVMLGVGGIAGHAFRHVNYLDNGYFALNKTLRNYCAVTGACMLVKRDIYKKVNGYDPTLKVAYNDVDFCLRVRKEGYLVVYTPYAKLYHYEGASRGIRQPSDDAKIFVKRWKEVLMRRDPYYNVNLTLLKEDFGLSFYGIPIDKTPLALLLEIYAVRPDLQKSFPEAAKGSYENLIDWAKTYGSSGPKYGLPHDAYSHILSLYQFWYEENSRMKRKVMEQKVV